MAERRRDGTASGPLAGLRVLEFAGIGPVPHAGMMLSDLGADVVLVDRPGGRAGAPEEVVHRGRRSVLLDLKRPGDAATALDLAARADVLVEGFRPGVMERLGLGPEAVRARNPALVYARMTGWGQTGPLARAAGHDLTYIAPTGALAAIGPAGGPPVPPLNLVGDLGGGALYLLVGILAALVEARRSGQGQVVDCAMCDGAASLMAMVHWFRAAGDWTLERGGNLIDGGAPFYGVYECRDGRHIAVAAIEPAFFRELVGRMGLDPDAVGAPDRARWPELRALFARTFRTRTRDEWCALLEGGDACAAPVLDLDEAASHPHLAARGTLVAPDGVTQPAPAPRFSRTPGRIQGPPPRPGEGQAEVLRDWGLVAQPE